MLIADIIIITVIVVILFYTGTQNDRDYTVVN
mgnify:CR=1 FL=1